ncbi:hypothetical protein LXL04_026370 [Taraxacum kok-saghyz]
MISGDIRGRASCYKQDWIAGIRFRFGILAPTTYIFFSSTLPVVAFGEQHRRDTAVIACALCRFWILLLYVASYNHLGVKPLMIMYNYLYNFAKEKQDLGQQLFWLGLYGNILVQLVFTNSFIFQFQIC